MRSLKRSSRALFYCLQLFVLFIPVFAIADTLSLNNGDRITGTLQGVSGDIVEFETDYAGVLRVDQEQVAQIQTEGAFTVVEKDGTRHDSTIDSTIAIETIQYARAESGSGFGDVSGLATELNLAATYSQGNSATQLYLLTTDSQLIRAKSEHVFKSSFQFDQVEGEHLKNQVDLSYKVRSFFRNDWFYALSADGYRDPIKSIDLRVSPSLGLGHRFWEHTYGKLTVETGVAAIFEKSMTESTDPALSWELEYVRRILGGRLEAVHEHRIVSTTDAGIVIDSSNGLKYALLENVSLNLLATLRHDTNVPVGVEQTDITYVAGVGLSF